MTKGNFVHKISRDKRQRWERVEGKACQREPIDAVSRFQYLPLKVRPGADPVKTVVGYVLHALSVISEISIVDLIRVEPRITSSL